MKRTRIYCAALLVVFCAFGVADADVMNYEFLGGRSTVFQTGGFAGVRITYPIQGKFSLRTNAAGAAFENVDATLGPPEFWYNLEELFSMTALTGSVTGATNIKFTGLTQNGIRGVTIRIDVTLQNDLAVLTGELDQNDLVCDGFGYELNAVARIASQPRLGDANGDGEVDDRDYKSLVAQFGRPAGSDSADNADLNGDGKIDLKDFAILRRNFGSSINSAPNIEPGATAPEPATLILLAAGLPALAKRKRRK